MIIHCAARHTHRFFEISRAHAANFSFTTMGFRTRVHSLRRGGRGGARLCRTGSRRIGLRKGDAVVFFCENRPGWIVAFWGCLLCGMVVVADRLSIVSRTSWRVVSRIVGQSWCWLARTCRDLADTASGPVWRLHDLEWTGGTPAGRLNRARRRRRRSSSRRARPPSPRAWSSPTGTSSPTSCRSNARCVKYRKWSTPFFADPIPESAAAQSHVRPGDGHLHPADAAGRRDLHARLQPRRDCVDDQEPPRVGAGLGARKFSTCCASTRSALPRVAHSEPAARRAAAPPFASCGAGGSHRQRPPDVRMEVLGVRRRRRAARAATSKPSGANAGSRSSRATASPKRRRSSRSTIRSARSADRSARRSPASR